MNINIYIYGQSQGHGQGHVVWGPPCLLCIYYFYFIFEKKKRVRGSSDVVFFCRGYRRTRFVCLGLHLQLLLQRPRRMTPRTQPFSPLPSHHSLSPVISDSSIVRNGRRTCMTRAPSESGGAISVVFVVRVVLVRYIWDASTRKRTPRWRTIGRPSPCWEKRRSSTTRGQYTIPTSRGSQTRP